MTDATTASPQEPQDEAEPVYEITASSFRAILDAWSEMADAANSCQCSRRRRRSSRTRPPGRPGLTVVRTS